MAKVIVWENHSGDLIDKVDSFKIIDCRICGFRHIVPLLRPQEIEVMYKKWFYGEYKPEYFKRIREDLEWWNLVYTQRYQRFEELLAPNRRRILDIGSGPGFFLKLGKERGWEILGIEPSLRAVNYARKLGLKIIHGFLNETSVSRLNKFDVIHMSSVMEHLLEPRKILRLCYQLLKPNGVFCTIVANDYNPLQQILREKFKFRPWWVIAPEHINYFTIDSLKKTVAASGFEIIQATVTFPMEIFLLMGENYIDNRTVGRACHNRRKNFEFAFTKAGQVEFLSELYRDFAKLNIGRDIILTAKKPLKKKL